MDRWLENFRKPGPVGYVPAQGLKESLNVEVRTSNRQAGTIQEFEPELFFFVIAGLEDRQVAFEAFDQALDGVRRLVRHRP